MRHNLPLHDITLPREVNVGVNIAVEHDMVPEYEAREAAKFAGYTFARWLELPYEERVYTVAHYRVHNLLEAHASHASTQAARARQAQESMNAGGGGGASGNGMDGWRGTQMR